jgi:hypothetical protein
VLLVGQVLMLLVPLAMGLLVSARGLRRQEVITAVVLRSVFGLLVGLALVSVYWIVGHCGSHRAHWRGGAHSASPPWCCRLAKDWTSTWRRAPRQFPCSSVRCGSRWP